MIEKNTLVKALSATALCLALGALCSLAPQQEPLMKSFFALSSLFFLGGAGLTTLSVRNRNLYWNMLVLWGLLQAFVSFAWVTSSPLITALAWALTPIAYTTLASLVTLVINKAPTLTARQRMIFIMSFFLGGMHILLGAPHTMQSIIVYFIALIVFPVNVYELLHEPSEARCRLGHSITTTLLGLTITLYLLDIIGTIMVSMDGLEYVSMYDFFERSAPLSVFRRLYPHTATTLSYSGTFAAMLLFAYLALSVLPRACCKRHKEEDLF